MTSFLAIYRGQTVGAAAMVAVSADSDLVAYMATALLNEGSLNDDPILASIDDGRRRTLQLISEWENGR